MFLTKNMKKVLKTLNSTEPDALNGFYFVNTIYEDTGLSLLDFISVTNDLEQNGYITFYDKDKLCFRVNEKGRSYKEVSLIELRNFLFKSVIIPIAVSAITSLVTIFIKSKIS